MKRWNFLFWFRILCMCSLQLITNISISTVLYSRFDSFAGWHKTKEKISFFLRSVMCTVCTLFAHKTNWILTTSGYQSDTFCAGVRVCVCVWVRVFVFLWHTVHSSTIHKHIHFSPQPKHFVAWLMNVMQIKIEFNKTTRLITAFKQIDKWFSSQTHRHTLTHAYTGTH